MDLDINGHNDLSRMNVHPYKNELCVTMWRTRGDDSCEMWLGPHEIRALAAYLNAFLNADAKTAGVHEDLP